MFYSEKQCAISELAAKLVFFWNLAIRYCILPEKNNSLFKSLYVYMTNIGQIDQVTLVADIDKRYLDIMLQMLGINNTDAQAKISVFQNYYSIFFLEYCTVFLFTFIANL